MRSEERRADADERQAGPPAQPRARAYVGEVDEGEQQERAGDDDERVRAHVEAETPVRENGTLMTRQKLHESFHEAETIRLPLAGRLVRGLSRRENSNAPAAPDKS